MSTPPQCLQIDASLAIVLLSICEYARGPLSPQDVLTCMAEALYVHPLLLEAFEAAGIDPDEVPFPEVPTLADRFWGRAG